MSRLTISAGALVFSSIPVFTGCGVGMARFDAIMMEKVRTKAAFDLQCSEGQLTVSKIDNGSYGAVGCGKRAAYVGKDDSCWDVRNEHDLDHYCQVVPDTFVSEAAKPPRP